MRSLLVFSFQRTSVFLDDISAYEPLGKDFLIYLKSGAIKRFAYDDENKATTLWNSLNNILNSSGLAKVYVLP